MKKDSRVVTEFVTKVSDKDLLFVITRMVEQYVGDLADVFHFFEHNQDVNMMLTACSDADEFHYKLDNLRDAAVREAKKRNLQIGVCV